MQVSKLAVVGRSSLLRQTTAVQRGARSVSTVVAAAEKPSPKPKSDRLPVAVAGVALSSGLGGAAHAAPDVDAAVSSVVDIVRATGEVVKSGLSAAQTGAGYAKQAYEQVAPVVKTAVDAAAPVVESGVRAAGELAQPALSEVAPTLGGALSSSGLDTAAVGAGAKAVLAGTEAAATAAAPLLERAFTFLTTTEPGLLGQYALGALAAVYLAPPAARLALGALRGYAGDVSPASALDALSSRGDCVLVDIRPLADKQANGSPELPNAGRLLDLEYASIADRKVRGQLRNAGELEVQVTALQVAALKRVNKGMALYVFDRSGATARAVARELARRGFGKVYVVRGGFQGWVNARLRIKAPTAVAASRVEVLGPAPAPRGALPPPRPAGSTKQLGASGTAKMTVGAPVRPQVVKAAPAPPQRRALPSPGTAKQ